MNIEKFLRKFGYAKLIKKEQFRNTKNDPYNCSFDKCPKFNKDKRICTDPVPANEDCCWFLRWAEEQWDK